MWEGLGTRIEFPFVTSAKEGTPVILEVQSSKTSTSILTIGCVRVCVCAYVRTLVTETEAACAHSRMYFDL